MRLSPEEFSAAPFRRAGPEAIVWWMSRQPYLRLNFPGQRSGNRLGTGQLVDSIRAQLAAGAGSYAGCRLPPVRVLAHQLGVSKSTVESVYDELKAQGLVHSKDRLGLFVAPRADPVAEEPHGAATSVPPAALIPAPPLESGRGPAGQLQLSSVFIDPRLLPLEKLAACFRSVARTPGMPTFYDPQGLAPLREWIAARLRGRGIEAEARHVVITSGSQQALDIVTRTCTSKLVATESPGYLVGRHLLELNDHRAVGLPVDPFEGVDRGRWEQMLAEHRPGLVYLTSNFQNPSGYSYSSSEMDAIIGWSRRFGFGILEDDWGSDMLSYSEFKPSLRALGGDNVLYMNSFTKKLLPSLRVGYLLGNERSIETLIYGKRVSSLGVSAIIEAGLFEFLDRGYYDAHLRTAQEQLDDRYRRCLNLLKELMPEDVKWTSPGGGPMLWLELPRDVALDALIRRMAARGVRIESSRDAFFGPPHLHGFKIGYAFLSVEEMQQGLETLAEELRRARGA